MTAVATAVRMVWSADGLAGRLIQPASGGRIVVRICGERDPVEVPAAGWVHALECDYCAESATAQLIGGQPHDLLCRACSHGQFDRPADWVRPIPRTVIRTLYRQCRAVG